MKYLHYFDVTKIELDFRLLFFWWVEMKLETWNVALLENRYNFICNCTKKHNLSDWKRKFYVKLPNKMAPTCLHFLQWVYLKMIMIQMSRSTETAFENPHYLTTVKRNRKQEKFVFIFARTTGMNLIIFTFCFPTSCTIG